MKPKAARLPIITKRDEIPPGYVRLATFMDPGGRQGPAYGRLRRAVRRGELPAVKLYASGLATECAPTYVEGAAAEAYLAALSLASTPTESPGPLFAFETDDPTARGLDPAAWAALAERIETATTVAELGAVGDDLERLESDGTLSPEHAAGLLGAINRRHGELEPVATVAASLAAGDPGTVDRLAASLERVADALEELLRRSRVELDLEPLA